MKKIILYAGMHLFMFSSFAQHNEVAYPKNAHKIDYIDDNQSVVLKTPTVPNSKAVSVVQIGTSYNAYSILEQRQNQVVYNPAINTVAFVHRQNDGKPGGSGYISFDYSTDGGANWTINPFTTTPSGGPGVWNGNRYPNIGIYNPTSNTNPANAYMVQVGPSLHDNSASENGFAQTYRTSFKLDSSDLDETYHYNSVLGPNSDPNEYPASRLYVTSQGTAWYASTTTNSQTITGGNYDPAYYLTGFYNKYFITKGVFNSSNNNFDWTTTDTIAPIWYTSSSDGTSSGARIRRASSDVNMAWSVDGNTGYMVVMGADSNGTNNKSTRPYIMKTIDAGVTWTKYPDYDFSQDPTIQCIVYPLQNNPSKISPYFSEYDIVVDANNQLRIFVEIKSGWSDHPDSLGYIYANTFARSMCEVSTNSSNGFDVNFIDSVYVDDYTWWTNPSNINQFLEITTRPQASRSQDGTKLFYTWNATIPGIAVDNSYPDIMGVGHNISNNMWTPVTNLTTPSISQTTPASFITAYQTVAVDVIENNVKDYEIPVVYASDGSNPVSLVSDGLSATQYNFIREVGFNNSDFTNSLPSVNPCTVSVDENELAENTVSIFPNPTSGSIQLFVENTKGFNYTIMDVVGNTIASNTVNGNRVVVDLSTNAKGIYFVTVNAENGSITKKVMLTK